MQSYYFVTVKVQNTNATKSCLIVKHITCDCISVTEAEEGAPTKMAGTAAVDGNLLDFFDCHDVAGPGVKGHHLGHSEN